MTFEEQLVGGIYTYSPEELTRLGFEFSALCGEECFVALSGELGTGKTTFLKGLAQAWNISKVTSPTFTILNVYTGLRTFLHIDAYRIKNKTVIDNLYLEDLCIAPFCLAVEWPENFEELPYNFHLQ